MKRNIKIYISDIIEYVERAKEYIKGINFEQEWEIKLSTGILLLILKKYGLW